MRLFIFSVLVLSVVALLVVDCSSGRTRYFECFVADHHYDPPWVETQVSTDSDGHTQIYTVTHDEQFHVICQESGGGQILDVSTSRGSYYAHTNGQPVTVRTRQGKWTGLHYLPRIED